MNFEILKKGHLKRNIAIILVVIMIISAIILNFTRARYRVTESIPLVNGTINYTLSDLNIIGLYIDGVETEELDSNKTYILDTTQSTCTYKDGSEIPNLTISYDHTTRELKIVPFTAKGTKCELYFNEQVFAKDVLLANYSTQLTRSDFSTVVTDTTTGTIYYTDTSKGRTYYFAGNPTDNWVSFGGFYWRIIRINEDGSIRMIYQGTSATTMGSETQIGTSVFNSSYSDNMYVGYMYTSGNVHGSGTDSTIKGVLDRWYEDYLRANYSKYISSEAGFCGDRGSNTSSTGAPNNTGGTGTTTTYYAARYRLETNKAPTFECENNSDLYTVSDSTGNGALDYPIGLISADEVAYAGGVFSTGNNGYYLYTGQAYWTMSPVRYIRSAPTGLYDEANAHVYYVLLGGSFHYGDPVNTVNGVRPVINLLPDVNLTGMGTSTNPYVVS